jgi:hypothetical protein
MKRILLVVLGLAIGVTVRAEPQNPPPTSAFTGYDGYELAPLTMDAPYAGQGPNEKAKAKIQEYLTAETAPIIAKWNEAAAGGTRGQTLQFQPRIEKIKFIGGGARFWAGALAGDSYVVIKVAVKEQPSGALLAEPEFYQRAAAMSGAWTFGAQDNDMLHRIVVLMNHYLEANYPQAVGGPTGYDPK